jgi:hypothetical protein
MDAKAIRDRLVEQTPFAMLVRGCIDWFFEPEFLDVFAEEAFRTNYTRDIRFSDLVELLLPVVFDPGQSVRSAFLRGERLAAVATLSSFYAKLNGVDPDVSRALVRRTAERAAGIVARWPGGEKPPLPGYRVLTLDGNHLAATERRLDGLTACTALPGLGLVVRDFASGLFLDLLPIPDAYGREVSHAPTLLRSALRPGDCVVADREFCAADVFAAVAESKAFFVIRHRKSAHLHPRTEPTRAVRSEGRTIREQAVHYADTDIEYRAVRVELAEPTQDGDKVVTLLTNLPAEVGAAAVAELYRGRRSIETAFHELAMALNGEVRTLAYPKAALLAFALATAVYNLLQTIRRAIAAERGAEAARKLSIQRLCQEVKHHLPTLLLIYGPGELEPQHDWGVPAMRSWLRRLAKKIDLGKYERSTGQKPGSARGKRKKAPRLHESTQKLLDSRQKKPKKSP